MFSDIKEETKEIFRRTPEYWKRQVTIYLLVSFVAIGIVMITDFFIQLWWLDLILYITAFFSFDKALYGNYCYGQLTLMTSWDQLIIHYIGVDENTHTTYLLSEKLIDKYVPNKIYFLTQPDGQIILNENSEMLAFSDKESAARYGSTLEEDSMVMPLTLKNGSQSNPSKWWSN